MKKFITLLVIIFTATYSYAFYEPAKLTISSFGNGSLRVMIDGNKYNSNNNDFSVNNINVGYHNIKIYQQKKGFNKKNTYKLIYSGNIMFKEKYHTDIFVNRFGKAFVDEMYIGKGYYGDNVDWNNNGNGNNDWNDMPDVISSESFEQLKSAIKKASFDTDKLAVAKQAVGSNYFTSAQIKELMQLFMIDNNKLELAKYAYKFTTDKGNYFILNDAFTFGTYRQELMKYLETVQE